MNSEQEYMIRRLSLQRMDDLARLHQAVYGRKPAADFFVRKYDTAYTGASDVGFIAYTSDQTPVAFYGVIPCFLRREGKIILAAQSADTMTHPGHRKKGLFIRLARLTYDCCAKENISVVFGFPNQNSLPGFLQQLEWQQTDVMECFILPVRTLPLAKLAARYPFLKKKYGWYQKQVLAPYLTAAQGIAGSVIEDGFDGVLRDRRYLKYKRYSATFVIELAGVRFWLKISNGLLIGDLEGSSDNLGKAMHQLIRLSRRLGLTQLQFQTSVDTRLHTWFTARYPAVPSFPVIFKDISGNGTPADMKFTLADIDIF